MKINLRTSIVFLLIGGLLGCKDPSLQTPTDPTPPICPALAYLPYHSIELKNIRNRRLLEMIMDNKVILNQCKGEGSLSGVNDQRFSGGLPFGTEITIYGYYDSFQTVRDVNFVVNELNEDCTVSGEIYNRITEVHKEIHDYGNADCGTYSSEREWIEVDFAK